MASTQPNGRLPWAVIERVLDHADFDASRIAESDRHRVVEYVDDMLKWSATKIASFAGEFVLPSAEDEEAAEEEFEDNDTISFVWETGMVVTVDVKQQRPVRVLLGGAHDANLDEPVDMYPSIPTNSARFASALELARRARVDEEIELPFAVEK